MAIDSTGVEQWSFDDWLDYMILAGVGRDIATARSWLRVASVTGMIKCVRGFKGSPASTYGKGSNWSRYLDGGKA